MKAAVLRGVRDLAIEDIAEPTDIPKGYVKVAVKAVGICGSDVHYYKEGAIGSFVLHHPMVLGHEVGGVVVEVGEDVHIPVGSVVALEPGIPCGQCKHCRTGNYNLCPDVHFFATPPVDGAMTKYVLHPAAYTFIADGLTPEEASLAEPLSVGIYAARKAEIHIGQRVAVLGAGPVGLLTALAVASEGADVAVFDVQPDRVDAAVAMGLPAQLFSSERDDAYDSVIDCTGNHQALEWAQRSVQPGGNLILVGMGSRESMMIDGLALSIRGVSIHGIFRYTNTFEAAIALIRRHREQLSMFTKQQISLEQLPTYLEHDEQAKYLKTIVTIS